MVCLVFLRKTYFYYQIPQEFLLFCKRRINLLEFIASVVTIEMELRYSRPSISAHHHLLALTKSSSALGWLHHSTFNPVTSILHDVVPRQLGTILMEFEASHVSAHIKGKNNIIADSLSRDIDLSDSAWTNLVLSTLPPSQIPSNFRLVPLKREIYAWLTSLMQALTKLPVLQPKQPASKTQTSGNGYPFLQRSELRTMSSWMDSPSGNKTSCSQPLEPASDEIDLAQLAKPNWWEVLSPPPCLMYQQLFEM